MIQRKPNPLASTRLISGMVDDFYAQLSRQREEGKKVCWWMGFPLTMILKPIGVSYLYGEGYAARVAGRNEEKPILEASATDGWLPEICSYARCVTGCASFLRNGFPQGIPDVGKMPEIDFVIMLNPGCSTEMHWADHLSRSFGVPHFYIHVPYNWSGSEAEYLENAHVIAKQLKQCIAFLEDVTGRSYNWQYLSELVGYMKRVATIRREAMELCKAIPSPASLFDWSISLAAFTVLQGQPGLDDYFSRMKSEIEDRVKNKIGTVPEERCRLYWDGIMMWNKLGHLSRKFASLGASVVTARYTNYGFLHLPELLDPADPLESLAKNIAALHLNQNADTTAQMVADLCHKYSIDGIVLGTTRTCRPFNMFQLQTLQEISGQWGIPGVVLETDLVDGDFYSDAQIDTRLQAFVEMIEARKSKRS